VPNDERTHHDVPSPRPHARSFDVRSCRRAQAQTRQIGDPPPNVASLPAPALPATEGQAKDLVLRDGYTDVGPLTKGADGKWRGTAKRDDQEMRVIVDTKGKVSP
jgi:hypothetical protein